MRRIAFLPLLQIAGQCLFPLSACAEQYLFPPVAPNVVPPAEVAPAEAHLRTPSAPESGKAQPSVAAERTTVPGHTQDSQGPQTQLPAELQNSQVPAPNHQAPAEKPAQPSLSPSQVISWIEKHDPVVSVLNAINVPTWTGDPVAIYVDEKGSYLNGSGATAQLPPTHQPAILKEFHCSHILIKKFNRPQRSGTVIVYSFANPSQAFGAYSNLRMGSSNVIVRGDASSEDDASISFLEGSRFVVLTMSADEDDVSKNLITAVADSLSRAINDRAPRPVLITSLPVLDRIAGSERLFFGYQAARHYISVPFMQSLGLERSKGAVLAEYSFPSPVSERMKLLMIDYGDPGLARTIYTVFAGALAESHRGKFVQPDVQLTHLNDTYMLASLTGSRITLISGAKHKQSPFILSRQFSY